jgi:hypothetical protein
MEKLRVGVPPGVLNLPSAGHGNMVRVRTTATNTPVPIIERTGRPPAETTTGEERRCSRPGLKLYHRYGDGRYRCKRCVGEAVTRRHQKVKRILVGEAAGCCAVCGYDRWCSTCTSVTSIPRRSPAASAWRWPFARRVPGGGPEVRPGVCELPWRDRDGPAPQPAGGGDLHWPSGPHGLVVRTPPFQGGDRGFEPRWGYRSSDRPRQPAIHDERDARDVGRPRRA